jgi:membrane associated rhomboid family serine protease
VSSLFGWQNRGPGVPFGFAVTWTRTVKWLMGINLGVFVFQLLLGPQGTLGLWAVFGMDPRQVFAFPPRVWQLVTYMFLHAGVGHLVGNMLGLFFFAGDVERELGTRRFLSFYFACGVAGALLSSLLDFHAVLIGASAGVLGVVVAFAIFYPDAIVYLWLLLLIPVRVKYLAIGYAILTLLLAMEGGRQSGIAHWGHVGGMVYAFTYLWVLPRLGWRPQLPRWFSPWRWAGRWAERRRRARELRRGQEQSRVQEELDRILAKVHQEGLGSLSDAERRFLQKVSKRYRDSGE